MRTKIAFIAAIVVVAVFLFTLSPGRFNQETALIKWGNAPRFNSQTYDYYAKYNYVAFTPGIFDYTPSAVDSLKARNPKIHAGTYFNVHTIAQWTSRAAPGTYARALWDGLSPFYVRTTEGDTACLWLNEPLYDFTSPTVRSIATTTLAEYMRRHSLDLVFLDFFSDPLPDLKKFQAPMYQQLQRGEWDFDRDGVGYFDDPDERALVKRAEYDFMRELIAAMPNFIFVPNGDLAIKEDKFASLCDGLNLENFPCYFFGVVNPVTQADYNKAFANAVDPDYVYSLERLTSNRYRRNPGLVWIEDRYGRGTYGNIAVMFDGVVECMNQQLDSSLPAPPRMFNLVMPKPMHFERTASGISLSRTFGDTTLTISY